MIIHYLYISYLIHFFISQWQKMKISKNLDVKQMMDHAELHAIFCPTLSSSPSLLCSFFPHETNKYQVLSCVHLLHILPSFFPTIFASKMALSILKGLLQDYVQSLIEEVTTNILVSFSFNYLLVYTILSSSSYY